jgi:5,10-methylene-tetrahydrofolate dehydrogenase/methenyl tetrahydrofolate cyclohydrolase
LVDESFVRDDKTQIVIDIGYGIRDWKAFGDVNSDKISDKVLAYSPVPWWAWAVTIASIFENLRVLKRLRDQNII